MKSVHVRDELHRQLKSIAAERGETLISVLEQLVETGLKDYRRRKRAEQKVSDLVSSLRAKVSTLPNRDFVFDAEHQRLFLENAQALAPYIPTVTADEEIG
ncbi:MAG TPA: hypothetical protein EYP55_09420 [Anaerolineae bacterium]|nr:hypothetical protein [Anaerolineae bacterium]